MNDDISLFKDVALFNHLIIAPQVLPADDFVNYFCHVLDTLMERHAYIGELKALHFKILRVTITDGEVFIL